MGCRRVGIQWWWVAVKARRGMFALTKKVVWKQKPLTQVAGIFDMFSSTKTSLINFPLPLIKDEEAHMFAAQSLKLDWAKGSQATNLSLVIKLPQLDCRLLLRKHKGPTSVLFKEHTPHEEFSIRWSKSDHSFLKSTNATTTSNYMYYIYSVVHYITQAFMFLWWVWWAHLSQQFN